jgi:hypothetical protein
MAKLLLNYTILDQDYQNGEFRYFSGNAGTTPGDVDLPQSVSPYFAAATDSDPELCSYMGSDGNPRVLACVVSTSGTSTGKYFLYKANLSGGAIVWSLLSSPAGIELQDSKGDPLAGNPYGVVQAGNFLYINDYDSRNIYTINIANFESAATGGRTAYAVDNTTPVQGPAGSPHGVSLVVLTDNNANPVLTYLYDLHAFETSYVYDFSRVTRFTVDTATGVLSADAFVSVGKNAMALVPAADKSGFNILVPCVGGSQRAGLTNGEDSTLHRVNAFGSTISSTLVLKGDGGTPTPTSPAVTPAGNYDIKSVAVSASGDVWLLTVSNDANYKSWWRLFKTTMATLLAFTGSKTLAGAISDGDLTPLDSGFGSPGYYWELLFENSAGGSGRLWFVMGTPIRVSAGNDYNNQVFFDEGVLYAPVSGNLLYGTNINSADLIGEMIYQYGLGHSTDTRLIKGKAAAPAAKAALASAAAPAEEEEK